MSIPPFLLLNHCARAGCGAGLEALRLRAHALDTVEAALRPAEDDRTERTLGTGGRPNLIGQVELDAGVMDGRTRRSGAVAALTGFLHPVSVARQVMERLPHVFLCGEGAARFAREIGAEHGWLLTRESEEEWQEWLLDNLTADDWRRFPEVPLSGIAWKAAIPETRRVAIAEARRIAAAAAARDDSADDPPDGVGGSPDAAPEGPRDTAIALAGWGSEIASATSTSGWAFKYPGRIGDSALAGCGHYADARAGAAACTHTGEMAIRAGTSRSVVLHMELGRSVEEACRIAIADVRRLEGGYLDELVVHAVDLEGRPCVGTTGISAPYWWWTEGMNEPVRRDAVVM